MIPQKGETIVKIDTITVDCDSIVADKKTNNKVIVKYRNVYKTDTIVKEKTIVKDDVYQMRAVVSQWIANANINVILVTGGTGFTDRDSTPEALTPLFDKAVDGFGELFRQLSYNEIATSTIQSRAIAGLANSTVIFCMPGSTGACKTAWQQIIKTQLDASHKPCNFVPHLNLSANACSTRG